MSNKTPINDLVDLADKYTVDEWMHAAHIAATTTVDETCRMMAQIRDYREFQGLLK